MFLPFSITVAERPPIWERAVNSVKCACLSWALAKFCMCPSVLWVGCGILLIPDHSLSLYFVICYLFGFCFLFSLHGYFLYFI